MLRTLKAVIAILGAVTAAPIILTPEGDGKEVGLVWVQGASCKSEAYVKLGKAFQQAAQAQGLKAYVGITDFIFDTPEPVLIDKYINEVTDGLAKAGLKEKAYYIAAHSLGGVMAQNYSEEQGSKFKAQFLMGSGLLRNKRTNDNSTGHTVFEYPIPTVTFAGTKDGLYRISRNAEAYWHQVMNIAPN